MSNSTPELFAESGSKCSSSVPVALCQKKATVLWNSCIIFFGDSCDQKGLKLKLCKSC